jgi:prevent-host-death family protein
LPKETQFYTLGTNEENAMTRKLSLKAARNQFSDIIDRAGRLSERVVVTKNGRPEAVVMGADEFASWVETLELLSNPKAVKSLKQGLKEAKAGKLHSFKAVFGEEQ